LDVRLLIQSAQPTFATNLPRSCPHQGVNASRSVHQRTPVSRSKHQH
jgi:hypothetical protein